ncbi:low temperature requirement protein A [Micromonospora sp. AMSO31t]|nr:low temperature requirement protein A [Micromonospora sp. AMSO31t]
MAGGGRGTRLSRTVGRLGLRYPGGPGLSEERHATWLELFFDLVFALALLGVTARLDTRASPSAAELALAIVLYLVIQWSWLGQSFYDTRYDPDDTAQRLLVLTTTVGAGAIALGVPQAPSGLLLPVGYLIVRGCLLLMYLRVLTADRTAGDLVAVYLTGFGSGWLLWVGSLAVPPAVRPAVWTTALAIELLTPWLGRRWLRRHPVHRTHLPERLGQFTVILLGATLTNLRDAIPTTHSPARVLAAALVAFLMPASIWWIYITYANSGLALPRLGSGNGYAYLHVAAGAAVMFLGWALGVAVYEVGQSHQMPIHARLVLGGSIVTWMVCGLGLHRFALGRLPRRRLVVGLGGITLAIVVALVVTDPGRLLAFNSAMLVGYAIVVNAQIAKAAKGHQ